MSQCRLSCMDDRFPGQRSQASRRYPSVHYQSLDSGTVAGEICLNRFELTAQRDIGKRRPLAATLDSEVTKEYILGNKHSLERVWESSRHTMKNEFTAIIERDGEWYIAYCPEIPGANGQGKTKDEARENLAEAIELILEDRREDGLRGVPPEAIRETVTVK